MSTSAITPNKSAVEAWPPPQGSWTYDDYALLPDNGMRYEVIRGDLQMLPMPLVRHQVILGELYFQIANFLCQKPLGEVFLSPLDVLLKEKTNVQPDLCFIRQERLGIVETSYINGSPDLVIEILSPSREGYDRRVKFQVYAQAGIHEYWIVDPVANSVEINLLRGEAYAPVVFSGKETIRSEVLPELALIAGEVFPA